MEDRLVKLEVEMETLKATFTRMEKAAELLKSEVLLIQKTLNQIKYFAIGGFVVITASEAGVLSALKTALALV